MADRRPLPRPVLRALAAAALCVGTSAFAQGAAPAPNSPLDAPLFYQLLIGEIEFRNGQAGTAYEVVLDAARRTKDGALFRRAMEIALQARAGEQALAATKAWRLARPSDTDAMRYQVQLLMALNRLGEMNEPLKSWLALAPEAERPPLMASLPRLLARAPDLALAARMLDELLTPYQDAPATRVAARVAMGRGWLAAGQPERALAQARAAAAAEPQAPGPALLALDLLGKAPEAEALVQAHLARPGAEVAVRLAYARALTQGQRYADAAAQLDQATRDNPTLAAPWLSLGALRLELKQLKEAEAALTQYLALLPAASGAVAATDDEDDDESPATVATGNDGRTQAWLMLAQAAEQRGDLKAAESWLAKVDNPQRALEVQARRASLLARQGQLPEARQLIRRLPERTPEEARGKVLAEAQLLRDLKRWKEAAEVLAEGARRLPDDVDLIYEQAMVDDKLERFEDMERRLKRVIELKPEHAHAFNALGYSLADRRVRLPEAKLLIQRALALKPDDPFITDSLGWVEFRLGNLEEAARLLRQAFAARPDTEIAAHLGEVLWAMGQQDEARRVWAEAQGRDGGNEVLRDTLARLKVRL